MRWVLKTKPEVGLQLFIQRKVDQKDNKSASNNSNDLMRSEITISNSLIDDLQHEEILKFLEEIENSILPSEEEQLES